MDKISVIIPTYNRAHLIERSARSVLNQTYENIELIIVDDGSNDNTEEIIKSIDDKRIVYYKQENGGASKARNTGVSLATADYIAFHDSDDIWRENKLEKQVKYMKENPHYGMVYCSYLLHLPDGQTCTVPNQNMVGAVEGDMFLTLLINNKIGTPTILLRKDLFLELGGFDTTLQCLEDWDFAVRFSESNYIGYINDILMDAYLQPGGISTNGTYFLDARCRMIANHKDFLQKHGFFDYIVGELYNRAKPYNCSNDVMLRLAQLINR